MPVDAASERNLGIVNVQYRNIVQADGAIDQIDGLFQASLAANVVARGEKMRSVQAGSSVDVPEAADNLRHFFEARAHCGTHACSVLDQDAKITQGNAARRLFHGFHDGGDGQVHRRLASRAWMYDYEIGSQRQAANEFFMESLDRAGAEHGLLRPQVDQVIGVDDQGTQLKFLAAGAKSLGVLLLDAHGPHLPHARAGGKNLQGVATEL